MISGEYFRHAGDTVLEEAPFHYRRCGLDNIYLVNGFDVDIDEDGEKHVSVLDVDGLHKVIGFHLVSNRKILAPKEIRFLRKALNLSQAELGRLINQSGQQIARWEKGENNISGPADRLLRLIFVGTLVRDGIIELPMEFLDRIDGLDDSPEDDIRLCRNGEDWLEAA